MLTNFIRLILLTLMACNLWSQHLEIEKYNHFKTKENLEELDSFISPNEYFNHQLFHQGFKAEGALIAVGTFRTLDVAALGNFDFLIQLDRDLKVYIFNKIMTIILANSENRHEFLELLVCGEIDKSSPFPENNSDFLQKLYERSKNTSEVIEKLFLTGWFEPVCWDKNFVPSKLFPFAPSEQSQLTLLDLARMLNIPFGSLLLYNDKGFGVIPYGILRWNEESNFSQCFLGNDELFSRAKKLALNNKIATVCMSLNNKKFVDFCKALEKANVTIAAVDISNVLHYMLIRENDDETCVDISTKFSNFVKGLKALSFHELGVIIMTESDWNEASNVAETFKNFSCSYGVFVGEFLKRVLFLARYKFLTLERSCQELTGIRDIMEHSSKTRISATSSLGDCSIAQYIKKYGQPKIEGGCCDLSNKGLKSLEGFKSISEWKNIRCLVLSNNKLTSDSFTSYIFDECYLLRVIDISNNNINTLSLAKDIFGPEKYNVRIASGVHIIRNYF